MWIYDRSTRSHFEEIDHERGKLNFLYKTTLGRILLKGFVARPIFSILAAEYYKSRRSAKDIKPFIEKHNIQLQDKVAEDFWSFNDFFTRKEKFEYDTDERSFISPCTARLRVYNISDDLKIKNGTYKVTDITGMSDVPHGADKVLVFRLAVDDYHRFIFVDKGRVRKQYKIKGELHTVRPISEKYKVYANNTRIVTIMNTLHFGIITEVDVGALLIGHIVEHPIENFRKADEKGYFEYGGSTIILIVNNKVKIDDDILDMSAKGREVKVRIGERIGIQND